MPNWSVARLRLNPGKVQFAGFVHREQLASYYALAEVFPFSRRIAIRGGWL